MEPFSFIQEKNRQNSGISLGTNTKQRKEKITMSKLLSLLLIGIIALLPVAVNAADTDTPEGSVITNKANASYSNSGGTVYATSNQITTNVRYFHTLKRHITAIRKPINGGLVRRSCEE